MSLTLLKTLTRSICRCEPLIITIFRDNWKRIQFFDRSEVKRRTPFSASSPAINQLLPPMGRKRKKALPRLCDNYSNYVLLIGGKVISHQGRIAVFVSSPPPLNLRTVNGINVNILILFNFKSCCPEGELIVLIT